MATDDFAARLLAWFDLVQRDLPWRRTRDPWAIWVSEIMLQQTRVEAVREPYQRFLERYPTPADFAKAGDDEVMVAWRGLGYYRRARLLRDGARKVVEAHDGIVPDTVAELGDLPGVGPYTLGAVASIAFGRCQPAVDGNVERVVSRHRGLDEPIGTGRARKAIAAQSLDWMDRDRAGDFNQAMMELGATVCTPKAPACGQCPLRVGCAGAALESAGSSGFKVTDLPEKEKKPEKREERVAVRVVERKGGRRDGVPGPPESSFLLVRRPEGGLLGGLWEFPSANVPDNLEPGDPDFYASCADVVHSCGSSGKFSKSRVGLGEVTHTFSHVRHTYVAQHEVWEMSDDDSAPSTRRDTAGGREWRWVTATELETLGLSSGGRKIYELLTKREKAKKAPRESAIGKLFAKKAKRGE